MGMADLSTGQASSSFDPSQRDPHAPSNAVPSSSAAWHELAFPPIEIKFAAESAASLPGPQTKIVRGVVFSDLHIFSSRSTYKEYLPEIEMHLNDVDRCVMNGDIFDFSWSRAPSIAAAEERAAGMIVELLERFPRCQFHYVIGNHDGLEGFRRRLDEVAAKFSKFSWHEHCYRTGDVVFLHGDVVNSRRGADGLVGGLREHRELPRYCELRDRRLRDGMQILSRLGIEKFAYVVNSPERNARRIVEYLEELDPAILDGTKHIYFGHTHVQQHGYQYKGMTFYNTGASLNGMSLKPMRFEVEETQ